MPTGSVQIQNVSVYSEVFTIDLFQENLHNFSLIIFINWHKMDIGFIKLINNTYVLYSDEFNINAEFANANYIRNNKIITNNSSILFSLNFNKEKDAQNDNESQFIAKILNSLSSFKIANKHYSIDDNNLILLVEKEIVDSKLITHITDFYDYTSVINKTLKNKIYYKIKNFITSKELEFEKTDLLLLKKIKNFYNSDYHPNFLRDAIKIFYLNNGKFKKSLLDLTGKKVYEKFNHVTDIYSSLFYPEYLSDFYISLLAFDYDDPRGLEYFATCRIIKHYYSDEESWRNVDISLKNILTTRNDYSMNFLCSEMKSRHNWSSSTLVAILPFTKYSNFKIWFYESDSSEKNKEYFEYLFDRNSEYKYGILE